MPDRFTLGVVLTHPVQYFSPWFRWIARSCPEIDLRVFYAVQPAAGAQAAGFGRAFEWDDDLLAGYQAEVLSPDRSSADLLADRDLRVDAPSLDAAVGRAGLHAMIIPGWHADYYRRASRVCRSLGIPAIYRGDSTLQTAPAGPAWYAWRTRTRARLREYAAWLAVGRRSRDYLASFRVPEPLIFDSPHAVDNDAFAAGAAAAQAPQPRVAARRALGLDPSAFVVLFAGKLSPAKRPLDVIRAAAAMDRSRVQVLIAGDGALGPACRDEAQRLGVTAAFAGFVNQRDLPRAYAAADCLAVPSTSETWGLVVNEALATGLPCVVSDRVGCAPDLVEDGVTGAVVPVGDRDRLAAALSAIQRRRAEGHDFAPACRARAARYSYARATAGLVAALGRLDRRLRASAANRSGHPRVIACCGNLVIAGGLERQTFEVLGVLRDAGASCHVIVNAWESGPIVALAERIGASWSTGYYAQRLSRRWWVPATLVRMLWDGCRTSLGLLRDARRFEPTHVLLPEYAAAVRNWIALWWLRRRGVHVVLRVGMGLEPGASYRRIWRWGVAPVVDRAVPISAFIAADLAAFGFPGARLAPVIYNTPPTRQPGEPVAGRNPARVIYVGQTIPDKGLAVLLDAVAIVAARHPQVELEIVGAMTGWESPSYRGFRDRLRARAAEPDLAGRVAFVGMREDVPARLAGAAVHCCPSLPALREGLGTVVLEAKQAGLPSVVTPVAALPEMVTHQIDGWIARDCTPAGVAEGLAYYLADPHRAEAHGRAARQSLARFDRDTFATRWRTVFGLAPPPP